MADEWEWAADDWNARRIRQANKENPMTMAQLEIYVMDRGWVVVGRKTKKDTSVLQDAAVVRRWGTTTGLGELADKGPQENTVLDCAPAGIRLTMKPILVFPCTSKAWQTWLKSR